MTNYPKADRLREQREAKYHAEQVRQKAEKALLQQAEVVSVKNRSKQAVEDEKIATKAAMVRMKQRTVK